MTLFDALAHKTYTITKVNDADTIGRRLLDMGFTSGTRIYVAAISPFKGTVLTLIRNCMIALRSDAALSINIKCVDEA